MDAVADPGWFQIAIENGVAFLVVVALFVVVLGMMLRSQSKDRAESAKAIKESARLTARGQYESSKAIRVQAHQSGLVVKTLTALISAVEVQPDRYVTEKYRLRNGGYKPEELEAKIKKIEAADLALKSAREWPSDEYRPSCDPDESVQDRIDRLRFEAEVSSSGERGEELRRRAAQLEAELTTK